MIGIDPLSAVGTLGNLFMQERTNRQQRAMFDQNMNLQRNKYTIAVDDMKNAGLNPLLAISKGISAPGGGVPIPSLKAPNIDPNMLLVRANLAATRAATAKTLKEENFIDERTEGQRIANAAAAETLHRKETEGSIFQRLNEILQGNSARDFSNRVRYYLQDAWEKQQKNWDEQQEYLRKKKGNSRKKQIIDIHPRK